MVITTTAIGFILLSAGVAVLGWQFLRVLAQDDVPRKNSKLGFLLGLTLFSSAVQNAIIGVGALFFTDNAMAFYWVMIVSYAFLMIFAISSIYLLYYIFLPDNSASIAMSLTSILGITGLLFAFAVPIKPEPGLNLSINLPFSLVTFLLLFIGIGVTTYVFGQLFFKIKNREIRILAGVIAILAFGGVINVFIRLVLLYNAPFDQSDEIFGVGAEIIGTGFILLVIVAAIARNFIDTKRGKK